MSQANRILVVDDELKITEVIKSYLEQSGYEVYTACSGQRSLELYEQIHPGLVILDLMLPDISGEEICRQLRNKSRVPIIMLTAKIEEADIVNGLDIGADDYITKPFSPRQLTARVAALLRRSGPDAAPLAKIMSFQGEDLVVDFARHEVKKAGVAVNLTPNEFKLLTTLLKTGGGFVWP